MDREKNREEERRMERGGEGKILGEKDREEERRT